MATPQPGIGDWYRLSGGALFEVVALDDDDGTVEIQYFDGTLEEMDIEDWDAQWEDGALETAEADIILICTAFFIGQMRQFHRLQKTVDDQRRPEPGAQTEEQHAPSFITAERLHRSVVY